MGALKGGLLVILSVLLFLILLVGSLCMTLSLSLNYSVVEKEVNLAVKEILNKEVNLLSVITTSLPIMQFACQTNSVFNLSSLVPETNFPLPSIPCEIISLGAETIMDYGINKTVESIYYQDYDCEFWDCFEQSDTPLFLISKTAKDYWSNCVYVAIIISILLVGLMFFLIKNKTNLPILVGSLLAVSSLPFMKFDILIKFLIKPVLYVVSLSSFIDVVSSFFTQAHSVFLRVFIFGLILIIIGIILRVFHIGFKISDFIEKFKKKDNQSKKQPPLKIQKNNKKSFKQNPASQKSKFK